MRCFLKKEMEILYALITGASSGIGQKMSFYLAECGFDLIIVARRENILDEMKRYIIKKYNVDVKVISGDLESKEFCFNLYDECEKYDVDIVINNAGLGVYGEFAKTSLDKELSLINTNIDAVHILTKLFLNKFIKKDFGYILNVCSTASFSPAGPLMSSYYASKSYNLSLVKSINYELKKMKSNVYVGALCPSMVSTNFNHNANFISKKNKGLNASYVAKVAITKMFSKKNIIYINKIDEIICFFIKFLPESIILNYLFYYQKAKNR